MPTLTPYISEMVQSIKFMLRQKIFGHALYNAQKEKNDTKPAEILRFKRGAGHRDFVFHELCRMFTNTLFDPM